MASREYRRLKLPSYLAPLHPSYISSNRKPPSPCTIPPGRRFNPGCNVSICYDHETQTRWWGQTSGLIYFDEIAVILDSLRKEDYLYLVTRGGDPIGEKVDKETGEIIVWNTTDLPPRNASVKLVIDVPQNP